METANALNASSGPLAVRWKRWAPTRARLWMLFGGYGAISALTAAVMIAAALAGANGVMIGGDFSAFHIAARAAAEGAAAEIYDAAAFQARLQAAFPGRDDLGLSWQYPPTWLLAIAWLAPLPYLAGYGLFSGLGAAAWAGALRQRTPDRLVWFGVVASPAAFIAFTTGQNGFLTGALLMLAAWDPKSRPILAGLAAGLLTMKPHLGLLIPVAFLAGGCWRAIAVAALTSAALAGASLAAYGADAWGAFFHAVIDVAGRIETGAMPLAKMASPYSAALYAGLPDGAATAVQTLAAAVGAFAVWRVWRRTRDADLRAAALLSAVFLAAPYGFYYELVILGLPVAVIAMRALRSGWRRGEAAMLAAIWALTMATPMFAQTRAGLSTGFLVVLIVFVMTMRRALGDGASGRA